MSIEVLLGMATGFAAGMLFGATLVRRQLRLRIEAVHATEAPDEVVRGDLFFTVDQIPGGASIEMEVGERDDGGGSELRFLAVAQDGTRSEWSGWFPAADRPIALRWRAFWD